jgi:RHS repeat-associated protein
VAKATKVGQNCWPEVGQFRWPLTPAKLQSVIKDKEYRETYVYQYDATLESVIYEADYRPGYDGDYDVDTSPQDNKSLKVDYTYYPNGDLQSKSYQDGSAYGYLSTFTYNSYGYQEEIWGKTTRYSTEGYGTDRSVVEESPDRLIKTIRSMSAFGGAEDILYGNSVHTTKQFDPSTGFITAIDTIHGSTVYQENRYNWYSDGALDAKTAYPTAQEATYRREKYGYDELERLVEVNTQLSGNYPFKTQSYAYDDLGNLKSQTSSYGSDNQATNYHYGTSSSGVNAVDTYTVNGTDYALSYNSTGSVTHYAITGETDRFIKYNLAKQPTKIVVGSGIDDASPEVLEEFKYNVDGKLSYKRTTSGSVAESIYYFGDVEFTTYDDSTGYDSHFKVKVANDVLYLKDKNVRDFGRHEYLHRDYQGSVEAVTYLSNDTTSVANPRAFGVFGGRESKNWKYDLHWGTSELNAILNQGPARNFGYTGHAQLDRSGFIHMQGRLYDPVLGRFLSPDPIVIYPFDSQNWNRYSYVLNNPTKYVDPTGYAPDEATKICGYEGNTNSDCWGVSEETCRSSGRIVENGYCVETVDVVGDRESMRSSEWFRVSHALFVAGAHEVKALDSPVGNAPISSPFGASRNCTVCSKDHPGTDYAVPVGTDVSVTASGTVVRAYPSSTYGNTVIVDHGSAASGKGNIYTLYAHGHSLLVSQGQWVTIGQTILISGKSGNSTGPHLHYEVIQTTSDPFQKRFYGNSNERHAPTDLKDLL